MAPSQPTAAVAGVQKLSRQHSSLEPFFTTVPSAARQLSTVCAPAAEANATAAINIANLFNFFMILLDEKGRIGAA
jgi:alkylhydroperoxidase family enzyme